MSSVGWIAGEKLHCSTGSPGALWRPGAVGWRRGGRLKKEGCVYNYGWFSLLYGRNQNNTVNIKKKLKCKEKKYSDNKINFPLRFILKTHIWEYCYCGNEQAFIIFLGNHCSEATVFHELKKVFLNFCCWLLLLWLFWIIKKGSKTIWPQSLLVFMYIRIPLLFFLVPGTEKRDYPFNSLRGIFQWACLSKMQSESPFWNFCYWRRTHVLSHVLTVACGNGVSGLKALRTRRL